MNAFRGRLLGTGGTLLCSNMIGDAFAGWMGSADKIQPKPQQNGPQNNVQNGGNPPNGGTNHNPNPEDNSGTNPDLIATIWDEGNRGAGEVDQTGGRQPQNNQQNQQNPQQPAQRTSEQINQEISQHLNSVGLGEFLLRPEDMAKLQEGDHQAFANLVNTRIQQSYMQAIQSSQKLFTSQLEKILPEMVEQAVGKSKAFFTGENLRSSMRTDEFLKPLMEDPGIAPVAETVMRQFIVKGADRQKALQLTADYFKRIRKAMDPDHIEPNPNSRTTFRGNPRTVGGMSFIDILKGNG